MISKKKGVKENKPSATKLLFQGQEVCPIFSDDQLYQRHGVPVTERVTSIMTHRKKSATYVNSYINEGKNCEKYLSLEKMEVPPLAPGIKESVDECTKKNEIQSQKRQYEITHMYYFVPNNSSHHPQKWIIRFHSSGIVNPFTRSSARRKCTRRRNCHPVEPPESSTVSPNGH